MSKGPQKIRGTQDIWGEEADRFQTVVAAFERVRRLYGFGRVEMPVFESTQVFARSIGETTDIVSKEMYSFEDRGGDSLTLAPRIHRRNLPRLSLGRLAAARAGQDRHPRPGLPLRAAAEGALPPVPPARRRDHRRRTSRPPTSSCIAMGDQLLAELGIGERRRRCKLNTLGDPTTRDALARRRWSNISGTIAAICPTRAGLGSRRIRCGSSTARSIRTGRSSTTSPVVDDYPDARGVRLFRQGHRRPRRRRSRLDPRSAPGARPRLLPPHRLRIRHRRISARRAR